MANEDPKKDNKKAIEEHEEDRTEKDKRRRGGHPDRACQHCLTLWPKYIPKREPENPARRGQQDKERLLGAPGIATRSKDATRGFWPYY